MRREEGLAYNIVDVELEVDDQVGVTQFPIHEVGEHKPMRGSGRFIPNLHHARRRAVKSDTQQCLAENYLPMVEEYLKSQNEPNDYKEAALDAEGEYEYDIYYFDDLIENDNLLHRYQV